jgi:CD63 antigen
MDNCCDSLLKYLIFVFNFFFFLTGVALISVGAYMKIEMANYLNFLDDAYFNSSILFIILGVVILVIGFFGCCGACTENACMMFTFGSLLAVVVVIEIGVAIAVYVFRNDAHQVITQKMKEGMEHYGTGPDFQGVTETWNQIQFDLKCCGVENYRDWFSPNITFSKLSGRKDVPDSCCKENTPGCGKNAEDILSKINQDGCFTLLETTVKDNVAMVGGIAIAVIVLQIIGVLVSCMLANNMKRRANYV